MTFLFHGVAVAMLSFNLVDLHLIKPVPLPPELPRIEFVVGDKGKRYNNVIFYEKDLMQVYFTVYKRGWDVSNHKGRDLMFGFKFGI